MKRWCCEVNKSDADISPAVLSCAEIRLWFLTCYKQLRGSVSDPRSFLVFWFFVFVFKLCSECQTAALVSLRPQRQYHSAQILTKSQPRAVCQSLIDPVILILFAQTWKHWRKKVCMTCFCQYKCLFPFFFYICFLTQTLAGILLRGRWHVVFWLHLLFFNACFTEGAAPEVEGNSTLF